MGWEEGSLGMVITFCHHDQAKVKPLEALSTLLQRELSQTKHSGGEDIHQFILPSMRVFQPPLSGHNHSFSGHTNHPIPTGSAVPVQAAPLFFHSGHAAT